jgi:hypothetical protein
VEEAEENIAGKLTNESSHLIPEQILGPSPKGIKTQRSLKAFTPPFSGSNLSGMNASGFGKYSEEGTL